MTPVTDPVERAARIIAAMDWAIYDWDDLSPRWQNKCRETARKVLDDYTGREDQP